MSDPTEDSQPDISALSMDASPPLKATNTSPHSPKVHEEPTTLAHRSHNPTNNLKRSDPFKFGSRYLEPTDDVFEFNAWDHVVPDDEYYSYAEAQYERQRASPVSDFDKKRFNTDPAKWWNRFYSNNTSNFFKDRKWLQQEFSVLTEVVAPRAGRKVVLEVGAGAGNTAFPILKLNENEELMIHACDFSVNAVELMRGNAAYDAKHIHASVWDISSDSLPEGVEEGSVDVVLLVFIFSALSPTQWENAVRNVRRCLKPGGEVCFRDYGKGDLTQVRFKKERLLEENFYVRGDGTRVYFFEEEELRGIWGGKAEAEDRVEEDEDSKGEEATDTSSDYTNSNGDALDSAEAKAEQNGDDHAPASEYPFEIVSLGVDRRMLVNRQKQLKMYRCWIQGRFKKPDAVAPG